MRTSRRTDERGMALAVAIFALVVIGALVAGAFYAGNLEQRTGRSTVYAAQAADAAESGAAAVMGDWQAYSLNNMAIGDIMDIGKTSFAGTHASYWPTVTRLNSDLFLIRTTGSRTDAAGGILAQRIVATVARLNYATATAKAAVTVTKPIQFNGNAFGIVGNDAKPENWDTEPDCDVGPNQAGVRSATTTGANNGDLQKIEGDPKQVQNDPTVTNDFFNIFGDVSFDEMKKSADVVITNSTPQQPMPTLTAGNPQRCNVADMNNWGEPRRNPDANVTQCNNYFPIVYSSGTQLKMSAGARGQGLLLIEGDIEIVGSFEWVGLIVAKGGIKISGNGNKVTGALLAQDVSIDDDNSISGNTTLQYSSCALSKAIKGSASGIPLTYRSWAQLY